MFRFDLRTMLPTLVVSWLAAVTPAVALTPQVKDAAGFFKPETVQKANDVLLDIQRAYHKDVLIETVTSVPADKAKEVSGLFYRGRERFFTDWATQRAREEGLENGIYVLVCKQPPFTEVVLGANTSPSLFTKEDRLHLRRLLPAKKRAFFRAPEYDGDLLDAVTFLRSAVAHNILDPTPTVSMWDWVPLLAVLGGFGGVWVVLHLVRTAVVTWGRPLSAEDDTIPRGSAIASSGLSGMIGGRAGHYLWELLWAPRKPPAESVAPVTLPSEPLPMADRTVADTVEYHGPLVGDPKQADLLETREYHQDFPV
jgi:uncharacterized membrane protein YgcG